MARFGAKRIKKFRALTKIVPSKVGSRISIVTPGIKRAKAKTVLGQVR